MIEVSVSGHWDGLDENGNPISGRFYDIENMPEFPDTLEGAKQELPYYKEYIDYYTRVLPDYDWLTEQSKKQWAKYEECSNRLEEEKASLVSSLFKRGKIHELEAEEEYEYAKYRELQDMLEQYAYLDHVIGLYDYTLKKINELEVK